MTNSPYPCLWFDGRAAEAARLYTSVFPDSRIVADQGAVVTFELNGSPFMGLNGGPQFGFNEAVSFVISCETQQEIDHYWERLTADGGSEGNCGWLKDKFGVSWQVVPAELPALLGDPERAPRVVAAFQLMKKMDIAALREA
ncbi:putative 3-demethylubiquinone-9 3-methyltransferase (glyoxalase superfamily) [Lewinella marina]|uniref:PhnB-like domain-containing protein n=1 Tax=Neolewinella marina TaxID=438751 RepID=A0A2G0CEJ5_9BACT|nr:VOC family protein [Neolewinella marina]NJB87297.1 putative 3-demethylubiquinone-9 3-methyltransferase (glyoxalase superfamily) [Neolewinella marina]PHK98382.1 hypothetical protein CGL56_11845 [Neolewinella marina]